jgi:stage III sporulation protein AD
MDIFFQATAAVLLTVILYLTLNGQNKELALLLTLAVCCLVIIVAGRFIQPVVVFLEELQKAGQLDNSYLSVLLKVVGIAFLTEVASLVCTDAGNGTLGKTLQMLGTCVILWLSIPLLDALLALIQDILGEV